MNRMTQDARYASRHAQVPPEADSLEKRSQAIDLKSAWPYHILLLSIADLCWWLAGGPDCGCK